MNADKSAFHECLSFMNENECAGGPARQLASSHSRRARQVHPHVSSWVTQFEDKPYPFQINLSKILDMYYAPLSFAIQMSNGMRKLPANVTIYEHKRMDDPNLR